MFVTLKLVIYILNFASKKLFHVSDPVNICIYVNIYIYTKIVV